MRRAIGIVDQGRVGGEPLAHLVFRLGRCEFTEDTVADDERFRRRAGVFAQEDRLGWQLVATGFDDAGMAGARRLALRSEEQVLVRVEAAGTRLGAASSPAAVTAHGNLFFLDEGEVEQQAEAFPDDRIGCEFVQVEQGWPGVFLIAI